MGLYDGVKKRGVKEVFGGGARLGKTPAGFSGTVKVTRTLHKSTLKHGEAFIVEYQVEESNLAEVKVGAKFSWYQGLQDILQAQKNIAKFCAACSGIAPHQEADLEELLDNLEVLWDEMTTKPDDNEFIGATVCLARNAIVTKEGRDYITHDWSAV